MSTTFATVALLGRADLAAHAAYLTGICQQIEKTGRRVVCEVNLAGVVGRPAATVAQLKQAELVLVFGGDGTFLRAVRALAGGRGTFLGVQLRGTLGFLTECAPRALPGFLRQIFAGRYATHARLLLAARVQREGRVVARLSALNEFTFGQAGLARLTQLSVDFGAQPIATFLADGLLMATPTGSTAYSLSAGGPIVYPSLDVLLLTPLNPHVLANRPIVLPADRPIVVRVPARGLLTADGQKSLVLQPGDTVEVTKAEWQLPVIHPAERNYFDLLREKLGWSQR